MRAKQKFPRLLADRSERALTASSPRESRSADAKRGVWRANWRCGEHPVVIAVTSTGEKLAEIVLLPGIDRAAVRLDLERLLDACDPVISSPEVSRIVLVP